MDLLKALETLTRAHITRETVEVPTMLSLFDFRDKIILDAGSGLGDLPITFSLIAKKVYCIDKDKKAIKKFREFIKNTNAEKKIEVKYGDIFKIPFKDKFFDIACSFWIPAEVITNPKALKELSRVAKEGILIVTMNDQGDEAKMLSIMDPEVFKRKREKVKVIKATLKKLGWKIKEKRKLMKFRYNSLNEIYAVYRVLAFKNKLNKVQETKLKKFLAPKIKNFTQGASFIAAYK